MAQIDVGALTGDMAGAMTGALLGGGKTAAIYAKNEAEKIAISIRQIAELYASGIIDAEEARLKLEIQKNTSRTMLLAVKGIGILTAEQAINAGLGVVRGAVNTALGFALL
jgi:transposase